MVALAYICRLPNSFVMSISRQAHDEQNYNTSQLCRTSNKLFLFSYCTESIDDCYMRT